MPMFPTISLTSATADRADSKLSLLTRIDLFAGLRPSELGDLARLCYLVTVRPGQALEVQDTPVRWWNVITSGHARVERDGTPLGLLGPGESWSEHSLLSQQRSSISVVALSPVSALSLSQRQFFGLRRTHPVLHGRLVARAAVSADRLALPVYRALVHMERAERRGAPEAAW